MTITYDDPYFAKSSRVHLAEHFAMPDASAVAKTVYETLQDHLWELRDGSSEPWVILLNHFYDVGGITEEEVETARAYRDVLSRITDRLACDLRGWIVDAPAQHRVFALTRELFGILLGTDELTRTLYQYDWEQEFKRGSEDAA